MNRVLFSVGDTPITLEMLLFAAAGVFGLLLIVLVILAWRAAAARREETEREAERAREAERQMAHLLQVQSEMTGRMQTMAEIFGSRTSDLARLVNERLDSQGQRMGQAIEATGKKNEESLSKLAERLAIIDRAQVNITELSKDVVSLQQILSNKQTRGAFGQGRMESIVADGLAAQNYSFQATLSNGTRPDCLVLMPNDAPSLVIDAKFPLESWQRLAEARTPEELQIAKVGFRGDVGVHVKAISEKYLIAGETQDTAFMFVPSESIFADIHEKFEDVVQKAIRARVVIVSPSLLMLSIQVVQALLRDVRMREQAHVIQKEVRDLLVDVMRLDERVKKLQTHFQQASNDIGDILVSTGKVTRRSERIEALEFEEPKGERLPGI